MPSPDEPATKRDGRCWRRSTGKKPGWICRPLPRRAFCALSRREIGIDAEELDRNVNLALAEKILSPKEKVQFDAAPDKRRALLTFWVLKEAQVKRTGEGLRGYPNKTDFSLDDPRVTEMDGCLVAVIE